MKRIIPPFSSSHQTDDSIPGGCNALPCTSSTWLLDSFPEKSSSNCCPPPPSCEHRIFCHVPSPACSRKTVNALFLVRLLFFCYYTSISCISVSATDFFRPTLLGAPRVSLLFLSCAAASTSGGLLSAYSFDDAVPLFSSHASERGSSRREDATVGATEKGEERNNWAVIVSSSRYWHNYRHTANALTIYFAVKRLGIPDSRILLMVADDHACSPRNPFPGQIFNSPRRSFNLYGVTALSAAAVKQRQAALKQAADAGAAVAKEAARYKGSIDAEENEEQNETDTDFLFRKHLQQISSFFSTASSSTSPLSSATSSMLSSRPSTNFSEDVEVDYRGEEVHVQALLRVLTGRHAAETPRGQRLLSDSRSHVLVYLTGHGGENFLKFQDWEEIGAVDLADAVGQMHQQQRYKRLLLIAETCQGSTLLDSVYSPNVLGLASSGLDESSYSHHADSALGVSVVDRWTYYTMRFFQKYVFEKNSRSSSGALREERDGSMEGRGSHSEHRGGKRKQRKTSYSDDNAEEEDGNDDNGEDQEEDTKNETEEEEEAKKPETVYFFDRSQRGESQSVDGEGIGNRYTRAAEGKNEKKENRRKTIADLMASYQYKQLLSTATARTDLFDKPLEETTIDEFFSAATGVVVPTLRPYWLPFLVEKEKSPKKLQQQPLEEKRKTQRREQRRCRDSFSLFHVPSYYSEAFLCLLCETQKDMRDVSRNRLTQQLQKQREKRLLYGMDEHDYEREIIEREKAETAAASGKSLYNTEKEEKTAAEGLYTNDSSSQQQRFHRSSANGESMTKVNHIHARDKSEKQYVEQKKQYQRPESFSPGVLHVAAAGMTALVTAAAAAFLL